MVLRGTFFSAVHYFKAVWMAKIEMGTRILFVTPYVCGIRLGARRKPFFTSISVDGNTCTTVVTFNTFLNVQEGGLEVGESSRESRKETE